MEILEEKHVEIMCKYVVFIQVFLFQIVWN